MTDPGIIRARSAVFGSALPTNNDGSPRPKLAPRRPYLTVHYTGAPSKFGDPGDSVAEVRSVQAFAVSPAKRTPWEYNYVLDSDGVVWEYAGEYQAAHSAGENSLAIGVLWLLGIDDDPTDRMIDAFRWFRARLVELGLLSPDHQLLPHKAMPGAATPCPGDRVMRRWADLARPWEPELDDDQADELETDDDNPTREDNSMATELWRFRDESAVFVVNRPGPPGKVWLNLDGGVDAVVGRQALHEVWEQNPQVMVQNDPGVFKAYGPIIGPRPKGVDDYGLPLTG